MTAGMLAIPASLILSLVGLITDRPRRWALAGLAVNVLLFACLAYTNRRAMQNREIALAAFAAQTEVLREDYLQNEGPARRGTRFHQLVLWLDQTRRLDRKLTEEEAIALLGPPDLVAGDESIKRFVYYYESYGSKDSVVYVTIESGKADFGYSAAGAQDFTGYRKYEPPSSPQPQPAAAAESTPPAAP
jgi:hypothetical protein